MDFGLGRAACWGGICKLAVLQSSTAWLQQPGSASGVLGLQGPSWGGARHSLGCCRAAQEAFWGWCQAQPRLLQSSTGCHTVPCSSPAQPGDFGLGRKTFDRAPGSLVLFRAAQDSCHLWWPGAACRFRAWQGILLGWHQAACSSAEQHRLAAAAWCSLRNSELAGGSLGVVPGTVRAAAEQHRLPCCAL